MARFGNGDFLGLVMIFIGTIIALTMILNIADSTNQDNVVVTNVTLTPAKVVNNSVEVTGRELVGSATIANETDLIVLGNNFSTSSKLGSDGLLSIFIKTLDGAGEEGFNATALNLTYTYIPDGTVNAVTKPIMSLIVLFSALAIVVFGIVMLWKGSLGNLIRTRI